MVGVQGPPVLRDRVPEHGPQLRDDPPPGVQPGGEVAEEAPGGEEILQHKPSLEQPGAV